MHNHYIRSFTYILLRNLQRLNISYFISDCFSSEKGSRFNRFSSGSQFDEVDGVESRFCSNKTLKTALKMHAVGFWLNSPRFSIGFPKKKFDLILILMCICLIPILQFQNTSCDPHNHFKLPKVVQNKGLSDIFVQRSNVSITLVLVPRFLFVASNTLLL